MQKFHNVQEIKLDETYLYLTVDGLPYRIRWSDCSSRLRDATLEERQHVEVSPSGYGLHWPLVDEDLAIGPLLQYAEQLMAGVAN